MSTCIASITPDLETVIRWTRYDGTPETLPLPESHIVVAVRSDMQGSGHVDISGAFTFMWDGALKFSCDMDDEGWQHEFSVGDLWCEVDRRAPKEDPA